MVDCKTSVNSSIYEISTNYYDLLNVLKNGLEIDSNIS